MAEKSYDKIVQEISKLTALELSGLTKAIEEAFGVSAAMPVMGAGATAAAPEAAKTEEQTAFKVTLEDQGPDKIKTIKALRQVVSTLGLSEAKAAVEGAPTVIAESASKADAMKMKETLEAAGAKVKLS